jgi:ketosteroid isomerase-like protein
MALLFRIMALVTAFLAPTVHAQVAPETVIRATLDDWMADFNAGRADRLCDLFDRGLRYDFRGFAERDYGAVCALLQHSMADPSRQFRYALAIREVLVHGDIAIVRLIWTLTVTRPDVPGSAVSQEPGLDVFQHQADGKWRIIRYIAYEEP